jgi:16S rRNA (guanine966-N2)-methyltransferase
VSIKILGGMARGQIILVPKADLIRPTSVMLRRRIFDHFQNLDGVTFVDLCAGSGAMGFEAWSRGASHVYLNEMNRHVLKILEENKEAIILRNHHKKSGVLEVSHLPAEKFIYLFKSKYLSMTKDEKVETILFLDPPYSEKNVYSKVLHCLKEESWFFGQVWLESDPKKGMKLSELENDGIKPDKILSKVIVILL